MPKPVIAALDPEHEDDAPLIAGARLASLLGAPLMVLGTYLHDPITNAVSSGAVDAELRSDTLRALEPRTSGVEANLVVKGGPSAARVLHDAAEEFDARLLVVGSTRRGPVGRVAPGTTAERLMHGSPCPVAIAPNGLAADWTPRRIGAGFIDLEDGHGALRAAGGLARATGAELRARTVVEPVDWSPSAAVAPYGAGGSEEAERVARRQLAAALATLPGDLRTTAEVVVGHPADALVALSGEVDLLVCGSRGYGPLRAVLLGGVTHSVMRKATCPMVVVPRGTDNALSELPARRETTTAVRAADHPPAM